MKIIIEDTKPKTVFFQLKHGDVFIQYDDPKQLLVKMPQIRTDHCLYNAFNLHTSKAVNVCDQTPVIKIDDVVLTAKTKDKDKEVK